MHKHTHKDEYMHNYQQEKKYVIWLPWYST